MSLLGRGTVTCVVWQPWNWQVAGEVIIRQSKSINRAILLVTCATDMIGLNKTQVCASARRAGGAVGKPMRLAGDPGRRVVGEQVL